MRASDLDESRDLVSISNTKSRDTFKNQIFASMIISKLKIKFFQDFSWGREHLIWMKVVI